MGDVVYAENKFNARRAVADKKRGKPSGDTVKDLTPHEQRVAALKQKLEDSRNKDK